MIAKARRRGWEISKRNGTSTKAAYPNTHRHLKIRLGEAVTESSDQISARRFSSSADQGGAGRQNWACSAPVPSPAPRYLALLPANTRHPTPPPLQFLMP